MPAEGALRDGDQPGHALIETLRWQPGAGFARLDRHLARLAASAAALGFKHARSEATDALDDAVGGDAPLRVRLTLGRDGAAAVTTAPFVPVAAGTVWRIKIAATRLDSADPLLAHKTTRRGAYDRARAEFGPHEADEVLLTNERGELCDGTITTLFADTGDGGPLLTPALCCGLLAGVLRGEMIDEGRAREAVLTPRDLTAAKALFVGNALRGLIPARLAD